MDKKTKGKLIYICGIDGAGKTTIAKKLALDLKNAQYISVSENSFFTDQIKKCKGKRYRDSYDPYFRGVQWALDILYMSNTLIKRLLKSGVTVILDRYFICNSIYTPIKNREEYELLNQLHGMLCCPDIIFWINVDPHIAYNRIKNRGREMSPKEDLQQLIVASEQYKNKCRKCNIIEIKSNTSELSENIIYDYIKERLG
ncbi:dTMP kinase [Lactobacillus iners]|uniref:dTMP kinase n=1 Tax=Lactobacillus iners TaxID=147802 RepID=UPI001F09290E|nr:AAA family ATPase [Lactobacillus iners]